MNLATEYQMLGSRIGEARRGKLTQTELAQAVGLTRTSIANIEAGRQGFNIETLYAIARTLSIPVTRLLPEGEVVSQAIADEEWAAKWWEYRKRRRGIGEEIG